MSDFGNVLNQPLIEEEGLLQDGSLDDLFQHSKISHNPTSSRILKRIIILLIGICIVLVIALTVVAVQRHQFSQINKNKRQTIDSNDLIYFFHLSDTHLDILYSEYIENENYQRCRNISVKGRSNKINISENYAHFGRVGCDASKALLESAVDYMQDINDDLSKSIEFILLTGDQSAHDYEYFDINENETTLYSIGNSTQIIAETFPDVPILSSIGNNDLFFDYFPPVISGSPLYVDLRKMMEPNIFKKEKVNNESDVIRDFRSTFDIGGFYKYVMKDKKLVILMLNTNYWNTRAYRISSNQTTGIGDIQLHWFNSELNRAKRNLYKVIISGHIPPGCDEFNDSANWLKNYTSQYLYLVSVKYKDIIGAQLFGHHHRDRFQVLYSHDSFPITDLKQYKSFLLNAPSITPIFKNSPAFRLVAYNQKEGNLYNYTQYYMDLAASNGLKTGSWHEEYSFRELYNTSLDTISVQLLVDQLTDPNVPTWLKYRSHIQSLYGEPTLSHRYKEYCEAKYLTYKAYLLCIKYYQKYV